MGTPYLCELRLVSFIFAPKGWAEANGQLMAINQNQAIFALLGTTYGGDGRVNFGLPNLQGRVAMHFGAGFNQGQTGGEINHTLTMQEMPAHNHFMNGLNGAENSTKPQTRLFATTTGNATVYGTGAPVPMLPADISNAGGSQPHENEQPYLVMNWIIALQGIFPSRN
jgi:microcystin-dependent protein